MSLNKAQLKTEIISAFTDEQDETTDPAQSIERIAARLSDAIDVFVKSGQVNVTVQTTGTAAAQTGTGTGNIT